MSFLLLHIINLCTVLSFTASFHFNLSSDKLNLRRYPAISPLSPNWALSIHTFFLLEVYFVCLVRSVASITDEIDISKKTNS
ncbi:hypothetical protein F4680DRAFT_433927 [Xylaria scruposa]|nr:hypothetical protein F4680DRAFT_433927 [Xylaria scruposa]